MRIEADALRDYLISEFGLEEDEVQDDTPLFSSELLDSFSMVDVLMYLEKTSGVRFNPADVTLQNIDSVSAMVAWVESATDE